MIPFETAVRALGLRKTRMRLQDENLRVINNSDAEKEWMRIKNSQSS